MPRVTYKDFRKSMSKKTLQMRFVLRSLLQILRLLAKAAVALLISRAAGNAFAIRNPLVIDGDTLFHDGKRIRILGIDAPESDQRGGADAKNHLIRLVGSGMLRVEPQGTDKYGRILARIMAGQIDLGQAMVAAGYALAQDRAYKGAERGARWRKKGLWSRGGISDPAAWRRRTA